MDIDRLKRLLSELSIDITLYSQLYGPEESVSVLNHFNGLVFGRLQYCLIDRIFIEFAKLMDKEKMCGNENLSFLYIIKKYDLESDSEISHKHTNIVKIYKETNIPNYRNKELSHNDLQTKLGSTKVDVTITPKGAHELLNSMFSLVNEIEYKLGRTTHKVGKSSYISLPREKDGLSFIAKLAKCV
ncbi:MAG: hypothetical protein ACJAS1_004905 [Oleiphilaceae bacterium]|jgi:hypothetical protein